MYTPMGKLSSLPKSVKWGPEITTQGLTCPEPRLGFGFTTWQCSPTNCSPKPILTVTTTLNAVKRS